ncbi:DUF3632 domain-containing protein [Aspergillus glaucus CBS 516.65]|uniref:Uncharacterized protein n=1 Tax=Aspergillus glaucus CBS 516.65 TaxID=1160497 RepID=A0A1L9VZ61_ASPGL|nr:hypothetical protein ASPGLDRAFT_70975 [Aspergillus glaucus CBS 516.65]OJJ89201.1 hypothetical protein ASPGLDRAFT_70975 [Aspergillus glaucus CBS 516.65]
MAAVTDDIFASRFAVLQYLFSDNISAQKAARHLASISLSDNTTLEGLGRLWSLMIKCVYRFPDHHDKLVDTLVQLSKLPDAKTDNKDPIFLHDMQWNAFVPPGLPERRQSAISDIINWDTFTALLMATEEPVFAYSWFALITLRDALETPPNELSEEDPLEALTPAAAAVGNAPGRGGPLWKGNHGFCKERWELWLERFGEVARMEGEIGDKVRMIARDAVQIMREIGDGDVE